MKKNSPLYDDEIDLIILFKIIWDGKIKILLIALISFLIGFAYTSQLPINYLNSITIKPSKISEFTELVNIIKLFKLDKSSESNQSNQSGQLYQSDQLYQSNQLYLDRFISDLKDYEEFLLAIKDIKKIQENILKLNIEDQEKELSKYAKLLEVNPKSNEKYFIVDFIWHDTNEARQILRDTLNLVTKNLKKRVDLELKQNLELEKKLLLNRDKIRLEYLKEQSAIAKELNIIDNQIANINLLQSSSLYFDIKNENTPYYLRGYKAINKEIKLIESRDYEIFNLIEQDINSFKVKNIKFVDYNIFLMDIKILKDTKFISISSIILGLIVGIFYVLISNAFQTQTSFKKRKYND
jgi:LPS O-antigen subunit length determinant protein (WzzB/FepE family)